MAQCVGQHQLHWTGCNTKCSTQVYLYLLNRGRYVQVNSGDADVNSRDGDVSRLDGDVSGKDRDVSEKTET
jgi:hypothetical protein